MAIKAFRGVESRWYTPESEQDSPDSAQFQIRPLTTSEQIGCAATYKGPHVTLETYKYCFETACTLIKNVSDPFDKPVRTPQEFLQLTDMWEYVNEVGAEIYNNSFLSEDEIKNL